MKNVKAMTYKAMEQELTENRCKMARASLVEKRGLIRRNHDLMVEMDRRWNVAEAARKGRV